GAEHDAWDRQLNEAYRTLMASRPAPAKTQLRDGERAWLQRTQHKCDHAGDDEAGGTLQGVQIDQCYLDETIRGTVYVGGLGGPVGARWGAGCRGGRGSFRTWAGGG